MAPASNLSLLCPAIQCNAMPCNARFTAMHCAVNVASGPLCCRVFDREERAGGVQQPDIVGHILPAIDE